MEQRPRSASQDSVKDTGAKRGECGSELHFNGRQKQCEAWGKSAIFAAPQITSVKCTVRKDR